MLAYLNCLPNLVLKSCAGLIADSGKRNLLLSFAESKSFNRQYRHFFRKTNSAPTIICVSNGTGGITDRFKSYVSLYEWATINDVSLKIYSKVPFDFNSFYEPADYDWYLSEAEYCTWVTDRNAIHLNLHLECNDGERNWADQQKALSLICQSRRYSKIFIHRSAPFGSPTFRESFLTLFRMTEKLANAVSSHIEALGPGFSAVSFRFVNLLQDSVEKVYGIDEISEENQNALMVRCYSELCSVLSNSSSPMCLVTTDSPRFITFLDSRKNHSIYYLRGGGIHKHIGFVDHVSEDEIMKSFIEFMLIGLSSKVIQIIVGPMYESKFPKWAANIGNVPYSIIRINEY